MHGAHRWTALYQKNGALWIWHLIMRCLTSAASDGPLIVLIIRLAISIRERLTKTDISAHYFARMVGVFARRSICLCALHSTARDRALFTKWRITMALERTIMRTIYVGRRRLKTPPTVSNMAIGRAVKRG